MKNKDAHRLILVLVVFLGGIIRFMPVVMAGFPVNDGGMFYVMVEELKANHFILPVYTQYNLANIPFAYPPFGFYITALISVLFRIPVLDIIRWLPPLVSTFSLFAFYMMADEILDSRLQAALATLFYGLIPPSFGWLVMGGGITRAFGISFMFLTIVFANRLFKRITGLNTILTALFGALAFLSHPETGLQTAATCILLWLFRGRTRKTFFWSLAVAMGVVLLTAPWWGTMLVRHGTAPFLSAFQSSDDGAFHLAELIMLQLGDGVFFNLTIAIGLVGFLAVLAQKRFFLPLWLVLPYFVDPRSAGGLVLISMSMLAAYGFDVVLAPTLLSLRGRDGAWLNDRFVTLSMFGIAFYLFFGSGVYDLSLAGNRLSVRDRETIAWVNENLPPGSDFLLLAGEQYSMKDPFQEWFPALTKQHSHTTLQGNEWMLDKQFFPFYGELVALQHCSAVTCIEAWSESTGIEYQYLLIKISESSSPMQDSQKLLVESARNSTQYQKIYETGNAIIFLHKER